MGAFKENDYEDMDAELSRRTAESSARKEDSGKYGDIFRPVPNLSLWKPGEGRHTFDIIPYRAGEHDPRYPAGKTTYFLDIWVHYNVGATEDSHVCPARTYKDKLNPNHLDIRCPICEDQNVLRRSDDPDEALIKSLNPRRRALYNVIVGDSNADIEKGVQVYDVAHWSMERHLVELAERGRGTTGASINNWIPFASPKNGKAIVFTKKGKGMNTEFIGHRFEDRVNYVIDKAALDAVYTLDEIIKIPTYDELYLAHHGYRVGESPTETSSSRSSYRSSLEEEDIPFDQDSGKSSGSGRSFRKAPETAVEETRPDIKEKETKETKLEEEEQKGYDKNCPSGGVFGRDESKLEGCGACEPDDKWRECAKLSKEAANTQEEENSKEVESQQAGARRLRR
jgi:hypothetical protein